ncbi:hypothetical protein IWW47_000736 [Coemansia sp. RSA 2052]|nr:hypothetical protein IWW47_000736 [Coemansia sp. RSA 2052]
MSAIEWHIRVKALMESGAEKEFQISALSDETVGDFRGRLATTSQVEPQKQRLIFRGRLLVDDAQKLVDAGVSNGSALHMVARPTDANSAERASSRPRGGRGAPPSSNVPSASSQGSQQQQTPFSLTPLAAQVMDQTFNRLRARGRGAAGMPSEPSQGIRHGVPQLPPRAADGMPQSLQDYMQRVIFGVHRDFGADNGGEWVASTADSLYYRIDREASPGSPLTDEELRRGNIQGQNPVSQGSNVDAYLPIPGLASYDDQQPLRQSEYLSARAQASRAQANELSFEMFESLLPALRRLPGHEDYSFGSTASSRPRYLSRATPNQIEVVGGSLSGLGDAFVEFGRSLQSVGTQWQNRNNLQPDTAYSPEQMQNHLQALRQLITTASVASPFLQTTLAQASSEQTAASRARARVGEMHAAASTLLQRSPHQAAILMANHRRSRRLQSIDTAMDMPRSRPHTTVEIEFTMNQTQAPFLSQQPPPPPPRPAGPAAMPTHVVDTGRPAGTAAQPVPTAALGSLIEQLRSRVDRVFQDSLPGPVAVGTAIHNPQNESRSDQNSDVQASPTEAGAGFAGLVDRLSAIGSQTARSDRSNLSTTTEYGSVIDATSRAPRFFVISSGGGNGAMNQIPPGFVQPNNPFSVASIFLGTEAGSTASTSRRASMTSNTSAALTNDAGSNAGNAPGQTAATPAPPPAFGNRDGAASGPRTGEVRPRSDSLSSSGNAAEGAAGSTSSGSSKRHKADEAPSDEGQGSDGGK